MLAERDEEVAGLEKTLEKAEDKLQELEYQVADLQTDKKHLQKDVDTLEDENKVRVVLKMANQKPICQPKGTDPVTFCFLLIKTGFLT